jgi:hypothetical protein
MGPTRHTFMWRFEDQARTDTCIPFIVSSQESEVNKQHGRLSLFHGNDRNTTERGARAFFHPLAGYVLTTIE